MRKITVLLIFVLLSDCFAAASADEFAYYKGSTVCVYEEPGVSFAGADVRILFCEKDNYSNIGHIGVSKVAEDGTYFYKFEFTPPDGKLIEDDYICLTKVEDCDVKSYTVTEKPNSVGDFKLTALNGALLDTDIEIKNLFGNGGAVNVIGARNSITGRLLNAYSTEKIIDYGWLGKSEVINIPYIPDSRNLSVFAWDGMKPLIEKLSEENTFFEKFEDNDVVSFTGDSIVHLSCAPAFIEHFYQTRYPDKNIRITNTGIGGDTVSGVTGRLDWDVYDENPNKIYINCGINDLSYPLYSETDKEITGYKKVCYDRCLENYKTLIDKIKADGKSISILGSNLYDEEAYEGASETVYTGVQAALEKQASDLNSITAEKCVEFFNMNKMLKEITSDIRATDSGIPVINGSDRVHCTDAGYIIYAALILIHQGNESRVAQIDINAAEGTFNAYNAEAEIKNASSDALEYTYLPKALPIAVSDWYTEAEKLFPLTDYLNNEIIKITGLENGIYEVKFRSEDNTEYILGEFNSTELGVGINIATNENNPSQIKSKGSMQHQKSRYWQDRAIRTKISEYRNSESFAADDTETKKQYTADLKAASKKYSDEAKSLCVPEEYMVLINKIG